MPHATGDLDRVLGGAIASHFPRMSAKFAKI